MAPSRTTDTSRTPPTLEQSVLRWSCVDTSKLVATIVDDFLQHWARKHEIVVHYQDGDRPNPLEPVGLFVWAVWQTSELETICLAIAQQRRQFDSTSFHLAYVDPSCFGSQSILAQAGAHAIVHQLSQLPKAMASVAPNIPLSRHSGNPLTQGLMDRLPWGRP